MRKVICLLLLVACLLTALISPTSAQTVDSLAVLDSSVAMDFPRQLSFSLSAESDVNITDIRLHYIIDRISYAQVTSEVLLEFEPAVMVNTGWDWDMRRTGGLPPGSNVGYWWTVENVRGAMVETELSWVQFDDTRYAWQNLTEGKVSLYWYQGESSFAREIMMTTQEVLARLAESTGARLEQPVKLYIYSDANDLRGAMIFPQEWTGGVAYTRYGTIAIGIAPGELAWGKRAIAHELTHLVIHQMTFNPYNNLPTWLDEGLAMYTEGSLQPAFAGILAEAIKKDELISVRSLSSPFSAYAEESALAYAQSYAIADFLINSYGQDKMLELLNTFQEGSGYDQALSQVYGFGMDGLDGLWRGYILE
ncbi:peptidase MA family metallohydrolase [Chloroflexota bacterium]